MSDTESDKDSTSLDFGGNGKFEVVFKKVGLDILNEILIEEGIDDIQYLTALDAGDISSLHANLEARQDIKTFKKKLAKAFLDILGNRETALTMLELIKRGKNANLL